MEFKEVLASRRMVRNYRPEPVDRAALDRIARAALRAPSAGFSQGFTVVVVTDPNTRAEIAALAGEEAYVESGFDPWISRAPAHIVLSVNEQAYHDRYREVDKLQDGKEIDWPVPYWWVDAGAALMAVLLASVDEGLAAGFLGVHSVPDLRGILGLPDDLAPIGVITVGHQAPDRKSSSIARGRRPLDQTIHYERFAGPPA
ncbi:MAG: nitroreductase family protein [Acidimicrobiia bacterium]|nr:nitroreductase family protein [Acidimicrobiia bacterium]